MTQTPSALPVYSSKSGYGFFGYTGWCVDWAVRQNNVKALQECIDKGWINKASVTFDNMGMRTYARRHNADECDALLAKLGWTES